MRCESPAQSLIAAGSYQHGASSTRCTEGVNSLASPRARVWASVHATGGADDAVCLVRASLGGGASADAGPAAALQLLSTTPAAHAADVNCVAWRPMVVPAPCLATAGDDGRVCLWRPV